MTDAWRVEVDWDGRRWTLDDVAPEISYDIEVLAKDRRYSPRTVEVDVDLGDTFDWCVRQGHHHATASVRVLFGTRLISTAPVVSIRLARDGELTRLRMADEPGRSTDTIPSTFDVELTVVNEEATARQHARVDRDVSEALAYHDWLTTIAWGRTAAFVVSPAESLRVWSYEGSQYENVYDNKTQGTVYQIVVGRPGETGVSGSRAVEIDADAHIFQVAGHRPGKTGTADLVYVPSDDSIPRQAQQVTVTTSTDAFGRAIAVIDASGTVFSQIGLDGPPPPRADCYIAWNGTAEGLPGEAGRLVIWLAAQVRDCRVDVASINACSSALAPYYLSGTIDEETSAWDLLQGSIVPLLPIALIPTAWGVGAVHVDLDPPEAAFGAPIVAGNGLFPDEEDEIELGVTQPTNAWRVSYAMSRHTGKPTRTAKALASQYGFAAASQSQMGLLDDELVTAWCYRDSTAQQIAADMLLRTYEERPTFAYLADPRVYGEEGIRPLMPGMPIRIVDPERGCDNRRAIVSGMRRRGDLLRLRVTLL